MHLCFFFLSAVIHLDEICYPPVSWMNILHLVTAKKEDSAQLQKLKGNLICLCYKNMCLPFGSLLMIVKLKKQ